MSDAIFSVLQLKLKAYKKKYYLNNLLKGLIFFFTLIASAFLIVSFLEYFGKYNSFIRFLLFVSYLALFVAGFVKWVIAPVSGLLALRKQMSDETAAKEIGRFFPEVQDKLLNTLQLKSLAAEDNQFIQASIDQKSKELSVVPFTRAINFNSNRKYLKYLVIPTFVIVIVLVFVPQVFVESTARIIQYDKEFTYPAPFRFVLLNEKLDVFKNEDYDINLAIEGSALPENVYLNLNGRKTKMKKGKNGTFSFPLTNLQNDETFSFEAAGYNSNEYTLRVFSRPDLKLFDIEVNYPAYIKRKPEKVSNSGNLSVPEGSILNWNFYTNDVEKVHLTFNNEENNKVTLKSSNQQFNFKRVVKTSLDYRLELENKFGKGKDKIAYRVTVIPDQFPQLQVEQQADSTLHNFIGFGGSTSDDYGITSLKLFYSKEKSGAPSKYRSINIPVKYGEISQNFFFNWNLDTLNLKPGEKLKYYLQVWDNDGVNGFKSTKSKIFELALPDAEAIEEDIKSSSKATEKAISSLLNRSKTLKKELDKFENKLKTKPNIDWQDKKQLEEMLKKHEELRDDIHKMQNNYKELNEKLKKYEEQDQELLNKMEQLQKLMDELMDEETKKLYDELQKMLQENIDKQELQKLLEQMKEKDQNIEKEIERSLEWFKQLQVEQKIEDIKNDLKQLAKEQKDLSEKSEQKDSNPEDLLKEQQELNEEFKKLEKELEDLKKLNESLEHKKNMEDFTEDQQKIKSDQQKASEQLKNNQKKKAGDSQQQAGEKMEKMAQQMEQMQTQMNQDQLQENMDDLRDILDNLLKLSFDQEALMKDFKKVNQSDPRYLELSQKQLKLKDDSRIIEDSLNALAKRVFQIQSFITRELGEMNKNMDASIDNIKSRRPDLAAGNQQFTMTAVNNLALMLNDVLKQMQQEMAAKKGGGQMCNKPGNNNPGLGEMQKQLNEQLNQLKNGQKPGEGMSKELAKMAAQQEMIRNALKELQKKAGGDKVGKELSDILKQMEESEKDLVNKRVNQELIMRQKEILTRLLEAEKSLKERDTDNERESNTGKDINRSVPPNLEKYLKEKEKQTELLKTVNPSLTPYYKKEVNEYFQKIEK